MMNVSIQMVSNLERGNKAIRIDNLINLSQILDISTDYILTGKATTDDMHALTARIARLPAKERIMVEMLVEYCLTEKTQRMGTVWHTTDGIQSQSAYCY